MPIYSGDLRSKLESIVIRILRGTEAAQGVDSLGMPDVTRDLFLKAIRKPQGMVIFTGPTGSGKTTSQLAAIQTIMDPGINIVTIEDPVEYLIEGCRQVKLNHKLDFEGALRGLLRHDPDVVMVGEMRDKTTAEIGVKLANTGHLIFSTLHTNTPSAPSPSVQHGHRAVPAGVHGEYRRGARPAEALRSLQGLDDAVDLILTEAGHGKGNPGDEILPSRGMCPLHPGLPRARGHL
jgi:hypothetical protein